LAREALEIRLKARWEGKKWQITEKALVAKWRAEKASTAEKASAEKKSVPGRNRPRKEKQP